MKNNLFLAFILIFLTATNFAQNIILPPLAGNLIRVDYPDATVSNANQWDYDAKVTHRSTAKYTDDALEKAVSGQVILSAVFSAEGKVKEITVIKGLPDGLTESAIQAAKKINFVSAIKSSKPISIHVTLEYNFEHPGLDGKKIKGYLSKEQPWLSNDSLINLANRLAQIAGISYYEVARFAPEFIKPGLALLSLEERREYLELLTTMTQSLPAAEQDILRQIPFLSGKEISFEDRQKSNIAFRKGWEKLSDQQQKRWRELHDAVVEFSLFKRRVIRK
jgi:TonB family protein